MITINITYNEKPKPKLKQSEEINIYSKLTL